METRRRSATVLQDHQNLLSGILALLFPAVIQKLLEHQQLLSLQILMLLLLLQIVLSLVIGWHLHVFVLLTMVCTLSMFLSYDLLVLSLMRLLVWDLTSFGRALLLLTLRWRSFLSVFF